MYGTKTTCYHFTKKQLRESLTSFFQKEFDYIPDFGIELPSFYGINNEIKIHLQKKLNESFNPFYLSLYEQLYAITDPKKYEQFNFHFQLLQLLFQHPVRKIWIENEDSIHVFIDEETSLTFEYTPFVKKKMQHLEQELNRYTFSEEEFSSFQTNNITFKSLVVHRRKNQISIVYQDTEENTLEFSISYTVLPDKLVKIHIHSVFYSHDEHAIKQAEEIAEHVHERFASIPDIRIRSLTGYDVIHHAKRIVHLPVPLTFYDGLSKLENVVTTLLSNNISLEQISTLLNKKEETLQEIIRRINWKINRDNLFIGLLKKES
jgi:hypothetical protein